MAKKLQLKEKEKKDWNEKYKQFKRGGADLGKINQEEKTLLINQKPNIIGIVVSLWIFLIHFNGFAVQETITTPLITDLKHKYTDTLDYPESFAYILFTFSGVLSVLTFIVLRHLNRYISEFKLVFLSCVMAFIGYMLLIDYKA